MYLPHLCAHNLHYVHNAERFRQWLSMAVARSIAAALAPTTNSQYAGAAHIFIMFCMYKSKATTSSYRHLTLYSTYTYSGNPSLWTQKS